MHPFPQHAHGDASLQIAETPSTSSAPSICHSVWRQSKIKSWQLKQGWNPQSTVKQILVNYLSPEVPAYRMCITEKEHPL